METATHSHLVRFLATLTTISIFADLTRFRTLRSLSSATGACSDLLLLFCYVRALHAGALYGAPPLLVSGARALLFVAFSYRVTVLVATPALGLWVVGAFAAMATACLLSIYST